MIKIGLGLRKLALDFYIYVARSVISNLRHYIQSVR